MPLARYMLYLSIMLSTRLFACEKKEMERGIPTLHKGDNALVFNEMNNTRAMYACVMALMYPSSESIR